MGRAIALIWRCLLSRAGFFVKYWLEISMLYRWKRSDRNPAEGESMCVDEREELKQLRKEGFSIGRLHEVLQP